MVKARYSRDPNHEKPDPTNQEHVLLADFVIKIDARGKFTSIKNLILSINLWKARCYCSIIHTRYGNSS